MAQRQPACHGSDNAGMRGIDGGPRISPAGALVHSLYPDGVLAANGEGLDRAFCAKNIANALCELPCESGAGHIERLQRQRTDESDD